MSAVAFGRDLESPLPQRLRAAQLAAATRHSWLMIAANFCNGLVVAAAMYGGPHFGASLVWLAVMTLYLTPLVWNLHARRGLPAPKEVSASVLRRSALSAALIGIIWGAAPLLFLDTGRGEQLLVCCVLIGTLCGGAFGLSTLPGSTIAFVTPLVLGCLAALVLALRDTTEILAAPLLLIYAAILIGASISHARTFRDNVIAQIRAELAARHDPLTGLANRAAFDQALDEAFERLHRYGERFALFYVDLDHLKTLNEKWGRGAGDELLRRSAACLRDLHDGRDLVARIGGDEFGILVRGMTDADKAQAVAAELAGKFDAPFILESVAVECRASVGWAVAPLDGMNSTDLLGAADASIYRVDEDFPSSPHARRPGERRASNRRELKQDMKHALARGEFRLQYQPIQDLRSGRAEGSEALVRWAHPRLGLVPPVHFIDLAETTGSIHELGEWILHEACREASQWPFHLRVAVNVSPQQLCDASIEQVVDSALRASGLPPQRLQLEVTESASLASAEAAATALERIHERGVHIVLDDFGTGFSTFDLIRKLPIGRVKIDRAFVSGLPHSRKSAAIVRSIVALAAPLGLSVTAEGIETEAQRAFLEQIGCHSGQGFLFARPLDPEAARLFMTTQRERTLFVA